MNIIRYLLSAVSVMVCLSGCIWEDRSDCTCDVILSFIYTGDGDTDIFPEKIGKVNMYVYSADGYSLEGEYSFDAAALNETQGAHLYLRPGNYRIVCWGNAMESTHVHSVYGEAKVGEPAWFRSPEAFTGTDSLYFSDLEVSVPETLQDVSGTCEFESSHIDMYVKLKGFRGAIGPSGEEVRISFRHTDVPAYTDFSNTPADEKCEVTPALSEDPEDEDSYILEYNVLRFGEDERNSIVLTDNAGGSELYSLSIPEFIDRFGLEVDSRQEAIVPILITLGPTGVTVEEWNIKDVTPGFDSRK